MKKIIALVILTVHLFNLGGYNLLYEYLVFKNDRNLNARLENVSDQKLLEIKIPLRLPYVTDHLDYERIDVQMEVDGISYNVVKRKILRDTLYLKYLPDLAKTRLHKAKTALDKEITQTPADKKNRSGNKKDSHSFDYTYQETVFTFFLLDYSLKNIRRETVFMVLNHSLEVPFSPPDLIG